MSVRNLGDEPFTDRDASTQPGHFGVGPAFNHEHEPGGGFHRQLFVPVCPAFGHVGPMLLGGVQRFFYGSTSAAAATNPLSKFQTDNPAGFPTPPAWHRVGRPPAFVAGSCAGRSRASCVRTSGFAVPRCPAPCNVAEPGARPLRNNRSRRQFPRCFCLGHRASGCVPASPQEWLSCPDLRILPQYVKLHYLWNCFSNYSSSMALTTRRKLDKYFSSSSCLPSHFFNRRL